ncbi:MAG: BMC domain-containing protein [Elusimicrobiota bacterium]|nr:BMC domain-containing protein [Elusimicrobiota bacterium]
MKGSALGIIETEGRTCLIEAVDSAIKCASVTLKASYFVGGGLNAVTLIGDVGAMRAALDAAKSVLERMNAVGSIHLIPRLADEVWSIIDNGTNPPSGGFSNVFPQENKPKVTAVMKEKKAVATNNAPKSAASEPKPKQTALSLEETKTDLPIAESKLPLPTVESKVTFPIVEDKIKPPIEEKKQTAPVLPIIENKAQKKADIEEKVQKLPAQQVNSNSQAQQKFNPKNRNRRARRRGNRK